MTLNELEIAIIKNIGIDYPIALEILNNYEVSKREFTGSGSFTEFVQTKKPLNSDIQNLNFHNTVKLDNGMELSAHIQLFNSIPEHLEICCLNWGGWDGSYKSFTIITN